MMLGADESVLKDWPWLAGAGLVIAFLFKLLDSSRNREIATRDLLIAAKEKEIESERQRRQEDAERAEKRRQAEIEEEKGWKDSWQQIGIAAVKSSINTANELLALKGKTPVTILADAVPESHSDSTQKHREVALLQTEWAKLTAVQLATGQEPRPIPKEASPEVEAAKADPEVSLGTVKAIVKMDEAQGNLSEAKEALSERVK